MSPETFGCTACARRVDAVDRFDRCLDCAEGKPVKRARGTFHAQASDGALANKSRRLLGLDPLPVDPTEATAAKELARLESGCVPVAVDEWGTTLRDDATGYEITRYTLAGKARAHLVALAHGGERWQRDQARAGLRALRYTEAAHKDGTWTATGPDVPTIAYDGETATIDGRAVLTERRVTIPIAVTIQSTTPVTIRAGSAVTIRAAAVRPTTLATGLTIPLNRRTTRGPSLKLAA